MGTRFYPSDLGNMYGNRGSYSPRTYYRSSPYQGYSSRKGRNQWPKGKKNSNAWVRIITLDNGDKAAIGGAWFFDFYRKTLFTLDITPKYSVKTSSGYESTSTYYNTEDGRIRYKVKAVMTNKNTLQKFYSVGFYNPDSGKVYFENIDVMVNFSKRTACMNPFSGQFKPQRKYSK